MGKVDGRTRGHKPSERARRAHKNIGKSREQQEIERMELSEAFLRPPYQYTSIENDYISRLHENDYLKDRKVRLY
jgi:hypothetical protein